MYTDRVPEPMTDEEQDDLVGINEVAEMAGVSRQAVANWRARARDFPLPVADLRSGPVFRRSQIRRWLRRRRKPMTHVVSLINLKGGVAKTTSTVALAEAYASQLGKKTLVIDIDPQTNATAMLIGEQRWLELDRKEHTLARLFKDALDPDDRRFDLKATLQKGASDVQGTSKLDLLPSSLDLIDVQDNLATIPSGRFHAAQPVDILRRAVKTRLDDYDIVLIDCPPNLGLITLNALRISDGFIIPTVPDVLSTYGIPQIVKRVKDFSAELGETIEPFGIVITKFDSRSTVHKNTALRLRKSADAPVFATEIPQANQYAAAAEHVAHDRTFKQKWGYGGLADKYINLADELLEALES